MSPEPSSATTGMSPGGYDNVTDSQKLKKRKSSEGLKLENSNKKRRMDNDKKEKKVRGNNI